MTFEVKKSQTYGLSESVPEVFNQYDKAYLNIVTCQGDWLAGQKTYNQRLVVFTELVDE